MPISNQDRRRRVVFISSNYVLWGGSEELWSATAAHLAEAGHSVSVLKHHLDRNQPRIRRLVELGCSLLDLGRIPLVPRKLTALVERVAYPALLALQLARTWFALRLSRPDLVVVSQGCNTDGALFANIARRLGLPYVLVSQKATHLYWPYDRQLERLRAVYMNARASYFVSEHNLRLTEEQLGIDLPAASVVRNPFLVPWESRSDWPDEANGFRLACIGRLYPMEKGQDLLLNVLSRERWRARPLSVTFFGSGTHAAGLERSAAYRGIESVSFAGFVDDVSSIWRDHHGLILPSRCEGLPLVVVEAMLSGRLTIATDVAGNSEIVANDRTGFLAAAASEDALDEAMERAWQRRHEWRQMAQVAAREIRGMMPDDPAAVFAETLLRVADEAQQRLDDSSAPSTVTS